MHDFELLDNIMLQFCRCQNQNGSERRAGWAANHWNGQQTNAMKFVV